MNNFKMVYVKWRDAYGVGQNWEEINPDKIKDEAAFCESIGFLIKDGVNVIVVCPHLIFDSNIDSCTDQGCGDMTIPVQSIVEMKFLKFKDNSVDLARKYPACWDHPPYSLAQSEDGIPNLTVQKWQGYEDEIKP